MQLAFFLGIFSISKSKQECKVTEVIGVEELGTEKLLWSESKRGVIRRTVESEWHCI